MKTTSLIVELGHIKSLRHWFHHLQELIVDQGVSQLAEMTTMAKLTDRGCPALLYTSPIQ
jgi:hypothetical protein